MYRQATPCVDELETVCNRYPPHLGMLALAIQLASYEVGGEPMSEDIVCEMVRDVFRIRDIGREAGNELTEKS